MHEVENGIFTINNNDGPVFVIGDIHGDYQCLIHCLVDLCKVTDITKIYDDIEFETKQREYLKWKPKNKSIIIFCGDLIHRKRFENTVLDDECSDIFIIQTIIRLKEEAIQNNGNIIIISGNHEIMNIIDPNENMYTSNKNYEINKKYFNDKEFLLKYIENSYAWIKINDILIAHGGLCSDYLKFLDSNYFFKKNDEIKISHGNDIIKFINNKYRNYFSNLNKNNLKEDEIAYKLFIEYDNINKKTHNLFWCREWGYDKIDCAKFKEILKKVDCNKMIVAHCPQFLSPDKPKMINFECINDNLDQTFNLARVDLGMSRSFEYNNNDNFLKFLFYNYNRKISVLQLIKLKKNLSFNYKSIITNKLSCLQYLLIKYGLTKKEWNKKNINSNWLGFNYIEELLKTNKTEIENKLKNCSDNNTNTNNNNTDTILCLLYPVYYRNYNIDSVLQFNKLLQF